MYMRPVKYPLLPLVAVLLSACSSTPAIQPTSTPRATDLAGYWSDADAEQIAGVSIKRALADPWLTQFANLNGGKQPRVTVGIVRNLSPEHISTSAFIVDLQRALIDSGKVQFIPSYTVNIQERNLVLAATGKVGDASKDPPAADFMFQGTLSTTIDNAAGAETKDYQVDMRIIDLHDKVVVWTGQQKIKKKAADVASDLHP